MPCGKTECYCNFILLQPNHQICKANPEPLTVNHVDATRMPSSRLSFVHEFTIPDASGIGRSTGKFGHAWYWGWAFVTSESYSPDRRI